MSGITALAMNLLWAALLYAALALAQRTLLRRIEVLKRSPIALNLLFLFFAINFFIWRQLPGLVTDAAKWCQAGLVFACAYLAIRILDYWVFESVLPKRKRVPVPVVLRDICRWLLATVALFVVIRGIFPDVNLSVLAVSSAVVGYILGNATQDTLGNLISGLALNTEDPFTIGDWVTIAGHTGRIVDMTWRATCLRTKTDDYITIPNAAIAREAIINYSRPTTVHGYLLDVGVNYGVSPAKVRATILDALRAVPDVLTDPAPNVWLVEFNDFSVDYKIKFFIRDFAMLEQIQSRIMDLIWYHFKRNGIVIPFPIRDVNMRQITREDEQIRAEEALAAKTALLAGIPLFDPLSDADRQTLAAKLQECIYAPEEVIVQQGGKGNTFYIVESGEAEVSLRRGGTTFPVAKLTAGDFFGEMSFLTGEERNATVKAVGDCVVLALSHTVLAGILESNAKLAEEVARVLEARQKDAVPRAAGADVPTVAAPSPVPRTVLLNRIRRFFCLDET